MALARNVGILWHHKTYYLSSAYPSFVHFSFKNEKSSMSSYIRQYNRPFVNTIDIFSHAWYLYSSLPSFPMILTEQTRVFLWKNNSHVMRLTDETSRDVTEGTGLRNRTTPASEQGKPKPVQFYTNFNVLLFSRKAQVFHGFGRRFFSIFFFKIRFFTRLWFSKTAVLPAPVPL